MPHCTGDERGPSAEKCSLPACNTMRLLECHAFVEENKVTCLSKVITDFFIPDLSNNEVLGITFLQFVLQKQYITSTCSILDTQHKDMSNSPCPVGSITMNDIL